jgi:hypothetical protein
LVGAQRGITFEVMTAAQDIFDYIVIDVTSNAGNQKKSYVSHILKDGLIGLNGAMIWKLLISLKTRVVFQTGSVDFQAV